MARDLIHPRTRREFREFVVGWGVLRLIESAFEVEGFERGEEVDSGGMRRSLFDTYANAIDWTDPSEVKRVLNVFEEMLSWAWHSENREEATRGIIRCLRRDGYIVDEDGRIRPSGITGPLREIPLETLRNPAAILEHLERLGTVGDSDPALAISSAKSLVEATCKLLLEELGVEYSPSADIPELTYKVQSELKLHPQTVAPTKKGRDTIVKVLGNLSQVAQGIAELRNEYGPDHGRARPTTGLRPRHAHLAVGCAAAYCRLLIETLADRRAGEGP